MQHNWFVKFVKDRQLVVKSERVLLRTREECHRCLRPASYSHVSSSPSSRLSARCRKVSASLMLSREARVTGSAPVDKKNEHCILKSTGTIAHPKSERQESVHGLQQQSPSDDPPSFFVGQVQSSFGVFHIAISASQHALMKLG